MRNTYGYTTSGIISNNLGIFSHLDVWTLGTSLLPDENFKDSWFTLPGIFLLSTPSIKVSRNPYHIFFIQCALLILGEGACPAHALFFRAFPAIGRYTQASLAYTLSRIVMTLTTAYGCTLVGEYFGFIGITVLLIVFIGIYLVSVFSFSPVSDKLKNINTNHPASMLIEAPSVSS